MQKSSPHCAVVNCDKIGRVTRGWCTKHYARWLKYGDPMTLIQKQYQSSEESYAARTRWDNDCLLWTGALRRGYGVISIGDKVTYVHRYVFEREHGPIPEGMFIDHICHSKSCSNPAHLRLATNKQNGENLSSKAIRSSSGYRNVYWHKARNKWYVRVAHNGKSYGAGRMFVSIDEANRSAIGIRNRLFTHNDQDRIA